jgi:Fur family ferric uptake transcriptional regulator
VLTPVPVSQTPESKFREYLASRPRPQRFTAAQQQLVRFIFASHQHFDAEQLCADITKAGLKVSRATVYRTLTKLVDAGLLRRVQLSDRVAYEHDYGYPHHDHLHCQSCGKIIEFQNPALEGLCQEVAREHGFQAVGYSFVIRGSCAECNRARSSKRRLDLI